MLKNKYLAAVSGGPDSMALLSQFKNDIIGVCHVNYHYRDTSDYDQSIVEKYCKKYNIKLYVLNINSSVYSTGKVKNFENWARIQRYTFFLKTANKTGIKQMLMGHNADDFVEYYFMQKSKKSKPLFYGIKKENYYHDLKIVRPLINIRKKELENYCKKNNIEYAIDITNDDPKYLRNKIRKSTSVLTDEDFFKLYREIELINKKNFKLSEDVLKVYKIWTNKNYDLKYFKSLFEELKIEVVYQLLINYSPNRISMHKIKEIIKFFCANKGNTYYRLNNNLKIYKKENKIVFKSK